MRRKRDPFSEGCIKQIYDLFFRKIVYSYCPDNKNQREFLEDLFDVDNRHITIWRSKKPFKMPGLFYQTGNIKIQGIGYRFPLPGTVFWVRHDDRNKDFVDIEFMGGPHGDQTFQLTSSEWNWVQLHLSQLDKEEKIA